MELDFERITKDAITEVVRRAVMATIAGHAGSALEGEVKSSIKDQARELCTNDPEIKSLIRENVIYMLRSLMKTETTSGNYSRAQLPNQPA